MNIPANLNYLRPVLEKRIARDRWIEENYPDYSQLPIERQREILAQANANDRR